MTAFSYLLMYFYFYSFLGWIWESSYVSICQRKWTNRGFLTGPMLPIYGSGAVVMLCTTYPVRSSLLGLFFVGMLGATLLEYVTGVVMEALFQVRYWDYSNQKFNFQGHICLSSSLAWGAFTILLVRIVHPHVSELLSYIPSAICFVLLMITTILFCIDLITSFYAAMDLRHVLEATTKLKVDADKLREHLAALSDSVSETLHEKLDAVKKPEGYHWDAFQNSITEHFEKLSSLIPKEKAEDLIRLKERLSYLSESKNIITKRMDPKKILLLKGNPTLTSSKYSNALNALKDYFIKK